MLLACVRLAVLIAVAFAPAEPPPPEFLIGTKKAKDEVTVTTKDHAATCDVRSPSGIGAATITPIKGWPKAVVLRLHLHGLESLTITGPKATLKAEVSSNQGGTRLFLIEPGDKRVEKAVKKDSPYWTDIRRLSAAGKPTDKIPLKDGYFELTIPAELLLDQPKSIQIDWIDFYRN